METKDILTFIGGGATVGAIAAIYGAVLNAKSAKERDVLTSKRAFHSEKLKDMRSLYEETITLLNTHISNKCRGDEEDGRKIRSMVARMKLSAGNAVKDSFLEVMEKIELWAHEARQAEYKRTPDGKAFLITSYGKEQEHQKAADALAPEMSAKFSVMEEAMAEHLRELEGELSKFHTTKTKA